MSRADCNSSPSRRAPLAPSAALGVLLAAAPTAEAAENFRCPPPEGLVAVDWLWLDHKQRPCINRDQSWCVARARYTADIVGSAGSRPEVTITEEYHRPPRLFVEAQTQAPWPGRPGGTQLVCRYSQDQNITTYLFEVRAMTGSPECRFANNARACQGRAEGCIATCR
ncbi:hypothetical protein [Roseospirillum parvum]|uniref:Uncharacterized protein n=1 Tax=Roseospirillum parvum TaxID=83401 RepID=A0A1G7V395_9PROT|nr:hypothetical protein [Roseospirillum parvum]SDG54038.1 hypothetical protein SAMN05421742_101518 [Roseospirillum parvum]